MKRNIKFFLRVKKYEKIVKKNITTFDNIKLIVKISIRYIKQN